MVKNKTKYFFFFSLLLYGCATVNPEIYNPSNKNSLFLLPLEIHILDPNMEEGVFTENKKIAPDFRIVEARCIIYKDFKRNILQDASDKYGFIFFHIKREKLYANWLWMIPFGASIGTISFIGFPILSQTAGIRVEVKILDKEKNLVAQYTGYGKDTEYGAMYWGYESFGGAIQTENNTLSQVVNAKALIRALDDVKRQIEPDTSKINNRLLNSVT